MAHRFRNLSYILVFGGAIFLGWSIDMEFFGYYPPGQSETFGAIFDKIDLVGTVPKGSIS